MPIKTKQLLFSIPLVYLIGMVVLPAIGLYMIPYDALYITIRFYALSVVVYAILEYGYTRLNDKEK